ncbi:MAG: hypothetical protein V3W09_03935, partial [Nitrososphaerales archaeon]
SVIILHFADHDPSGIDMTRDLEARLIRYGASNVTVERIALTIEQVRERNLEPSPTKNTDSRSSEYNAQYGQECWELDAIRPNELTKMVDNAVMKHMDVDLWNRTVQEVKEERQSLEEKMRQSEDSLKDLFSEEIIDE